MIDDGDHVPDSRVEKALENWITSFRGGIIVLLVIAVLYEQDLHGIGIIERISQRTEGIVQVPLGTIYALLQRFIRLGLIETYKDPKDQRKTIYKLNRRGKKFYRNTRELWLRYSVAVNSFLDSMEE